MAIIRYYTIANSTEELRRQKLLVARLRKLDSNIRSMTVEHCYHVETSEPIEGDCRVDDILRWLLKHPQSPLADVQRQSALTTVDENSQIIEIGPRFNFSTPFSTNCVNICHNIGLKTVTRLEKSTRFLLVLREGPLEDVAAIVDCLGDRMTQCEYTSDNLPQTSFDEELLKNAEADAAVLPASAAPWHYVPLLSEGRRAIEEINRKMGLSFCDWDMDYYMHLFVEVLKRDPTTVELFDLAQSNSEHSRHWFFRGRIILDGSEMPHSLIRMIMDTQQHSNSNNTIKFSDNSSAIHGFRHSSLRPSLCDQPSAADIKFVDMDLIFTAETHNMPTAVAPFSGATTGTGGRIRDIQGVGRGGIPLAGTAGYCVGTLNIPGYAQPYEDKNRKYPSSFARPLQVLLEASDGASDYGNKFGEPVIAGFAISYGLTRPYAPGKGRDEYVKPIMFSGGLGLMDSTQRYKITPQCGMLLGKIGGPVYRIGVGGGAASSVAVQGGEQSSELDFNAVQRGDPEMENKLNRVVRACIELGDQNPILAIHDQGAGGNGNVLKELVEPGFAGALIFTKEFKLGDPTINSLELWGAEYQENNAILFYPKDHELLQSICDRERCPLTVVGIVTGNGRVTLVEATASYEEVLTSCKTMDPHALGKVPFDMELAHVLGDMPKRKYHLARVPRPQSPLNLKDFKWTTAVEMVLSLVAVGSKRFLTTKVDRCVGGLVAQQQCVGPLQAPLADYGVVAVTHFSYPGIATSIGTQPIKGLINPGSMARMCVAEAISNLVFVRITELPDVKCSGNWMWAAKIKGEGVRMYEACREMCAIMRDLRIAVDGGKDSLSMAAQVGNETVMSPGTLVISTYAPCPDINCKITPDIKGPQMNVPTVLIWINIEGKFRLGGSALAQVYRQHGDNSPTLQRAEILARAFKVTQTLLSTKALLAGHDISDGGLFVCLIEMAIGGLAGLDIDIGEVVNEVPMTNIDEGALFMSLPEVALLFAEECGWVVEVAERDVRAVQNAYKEYRVPNYVIGRPNRTPTVVIRADQDPIFEAPLRTLYKQWERTSYELERLQTNPVCAAAEFKSLDTRKGPRYSVAPGLDIPLLKPSLVRVAVLREEGVNSDREMIACLYRAKFEVHDVTMSDLLSGKTHLDCYRGLVFPGGFSYADTAGSAKGWAANIMFSTTLAPQFKAFYKRDDVFSLGICNGCQLMSHLGWIGGDHSTEEQEKRQAKGAIETPDVALLQNLSGRFECRWSTVRIPSSCSILLKRLQSSVLGCWVAHGEGRFSFRNDAVLEQLKSSDCIALEYVDDEQNPTEEYPMNPNGSPAGIAGICSPNGRHLALMPHPERCSAMYQWPYAPPDFKFISDPDAHGEISPWQLIFEDAYAWCLSQKV